MTSLAELGERGFLERIASLGRAGGDVETGIGDDCAVVRVGRRRWLLTTDALVEGVHFERHWDAPAGLGRRAFAVNASDVGAMGGRPRFALLSVALPGTAEAADVAAFHRGFAAAAAAAGCALVGGNLSAAPLWALSVTLVGEAPRRPIRRTGARPGDAVFVTGRLGAAARARELLLAGAAAGAAATRAFRRPRPPLELAAALGEAGLASAAIDLSDGLLPDLDRLVRASGVAAEIDLRRLPLVRRDGEEEAAARERALTGGEDYELLFTAPERAAARIESLAAEHRVRLSRIGRCAEGAGVELTGGADGARRPGGGGFEHWGSRDGGSARA